MQGFRCPGLPAAWVNAWLAAVGTTVLDPRIRVRWTTDDSPVAVLSSLASDPVEALVESWPNSALLQDLPIAVAWNGAGELERRVSIDQFVVRAKAARGHPYAWALSSTMTDLSVGAKGEVAHAPFDPAGPGTTKWLHHRLVKVHELAGPMSADRLRDSLAGTANRVKNFGLGFDTTRLGSLADDTDQWIDPVVELLAFFGLAAFPVRGRGVDRRLSRHGRPDERQRGWRKAPGPDETRQFVWPAWSQPLDAAGVDALLDVWKPWRRNSWASLGVHAAWQSVRYERRGSADNTRAIGSRSL